MPHYNMQRHDLESLGEISKELGRLKKQLDILVDIVREDKFESLEIRNNTWLAKGLGGIGKFLDAVRESHHMAKVSRGRYAAEPKKRGR